MTNTKNLNCLKIPNFPVLCVKFPDFSSMFKISGLVKALPFSSRRENPGISFHFSFKFALSNNHNHHVHSSSTLLFFFFFFDFLATGSPSSSSAAVVSIVVLPASDSSVKSWNITWITCIPNFRLIQRNRNAIKLRLHSHWSTTFAIATLLKTGTTSH